MQAIYAIGDIEGNNELFLKTLPCLVTSTNAKIVFLGDLVSINDREAITSSVQILERIFKIFGITIINIFNEKNINGNIIKETFNQIFNRKSFNVCKRRSLQYWIDTPKHFDTNSKVVFIAGNQEAAILHDIVNSNSISYENNYINVFSKYHNVNAKHTVLVHVQYTIHEMNVLATYLWHTQMYHICNDILFLHCFTNSSFIDGAYKHIVCGHNKGIGKFKIWDKPIHMIDLSGFYKTKSMKNLVDTKLRKIYNYIRIENSTIKTPAFHQYPRGEKFRKENIMECLQKTKVKRDIGIQCSLIEDDEDDEDELQNIIENNIPVEISPEPVKVDIEIVTNDITDKNDSLPLTKSKKKRHRKNKNKNNIITNDINIFIPSTNMQLTAIEKSILRQVIKNKYRVNSDYVYDARFV